MDFTTLEENLKDSKHAGSQSIDTLQKFLKYAELVRDPLNVFSYMQRNCICSYYPFFWQTKAEYLAQSGDFTNAFKCLYKVKDMSEIQSDQCDNNNNNVLIGKPVFPEIKMKMFRQEMLQLMRAHPTSQRKTAAQFQMMNKPFEQWYGSDEDKLKALCDFYDAKFSTAKLRAEKKFDQRNEAKPYSWIQHIENQETRKVAQVFSEQIASQVLKLNLVSKGKHSPLVGNSNYYVENSSQRLIKSLNTPFKKRDPMKMDKTVDSVELMKRKKQSCSNHQNKFFDQNDQQLLINEVEEQHEMDINTMPVGRALQGMHKHVKFDHRKKDINFETFRQTSEKRDSSVNLSRGTSSHAKKGILRRSKTPKNQIQRAFPNLKLKSGQKTQFLELSRTTSILDDMIGDLNEEKKQEKLD